jgi:hypothetical protein
VPASIMWQNKGGIPRKIPRLQHDVIRGRSYLVGAEHILTMLCCIAGTDKVMMVSVEPQENQHASGSDVASCSKKSQSQHLSFRLRTPSNTPSIQKGYYNLVLLPLPKEVTLFNLQILAREAHGRTGTIPGKIAIWTSC